MQFGHQFRFLVVAADYERSVAYYRDTLGLSLSHNWDRPSGRGSVFRCGPGMIEVLTGEGAPGPPGTTAMVIEVADTQASCREIIARGGRATEPERMPWGHRLFRSDDADGVPLLFIEEIPGEDA